MSQAVDPAPVYPPDPFAGVACGAAIAAAAVSFGAWGIGMVQTGGPAIAAYLTYLFGTLIAPAVIVLVGWFFYWLGRGARRDGRSPVASTALMLLALHTVVLVAIAVLVVFLFAALQASFG